jgi:sulfotransferase family protein
MASQRPLLAYFGHHKCASTWIHSILDAVCADAGWKIAYLYDEKPFAAGGGLARWVRDSSVDLVSYVNANAKFVDLERYRGFHVVRDPRDLVVSAYFSHKHSHPTTDWPELPAHRERLGKLSKEEGLFEEMRFNAHVLEELYDWDYSQPHVLELRQEEFTPDPYRSFLEVFGFLGVLDETSFSKRRQIPYLLRAATNIYWRQRRLFWRAPMERFPAERLLGIVHKNRFSNYAGGREQGQVDEKSHYRKGEPGDWRNHFTAEHVERFKELYNDLLLKLGYESTPNWGLQANPARAHARR